MAALLFNVVIGIVCLTINIPLIGDRQPIAKKPGIPFMQVSWYLSLMSSAVYFGVSLATPAPARDQIEDLCWTRPLDALRGKIEGALTDPRVMAVILSAIIAVPNAILH